MNNFWHWLIWGLIPYYIKLQQRKGEYTLEIRALFWSLTIKWRNRRDYLLTMQCPIIKGSRMQFLWQNHLSKTTLRRKRATISSMVALFLTPVRAQNSQDIIPLVLCLTRHRSKYVRMGFYRDTNSARPQQLLHDFWINRHCQQNVQALLRRFAVPADSYLRN